MSKQEMSSFDAFVALNALDDEEIVIPASRHTKRLKEGKSFSVRDSKAMEVAAKFNEEKQEEDVDLEVAAVDPISDKQVVNKAELVGQRICQCSKCHGSRLVDINNLQDNGDGTYVIKEGDNSCPFCHDDNVSYKITGMAGVAPENEPKEEPVLDNDLAKPEANFDNDLTSTEKEGEPVVATEEPKVEVTEPVAEPEKEEETPWDETEAEDDTADMRNTAGDEVDRDDVKADDTEEFPWDEEKPEEEEEEEKEKVKTDILFDDKKKDKKEALNEELSGEWDTAADLFDSIIEPENIDVITVLDNEGNEIYRGGYPENELAVDWFDANLLSWGVERGRLILNVSTEGNGTRLEDALDLMDAETDHIDVCVMDEDDDDYDAASDLTKEAVIERFGDCELLSIEAPEWLTVSVDIDSEDKEDDEYEPHLATSDLEAGQWYESLTEKICEANDLRAYRSDKVGTQEYFIKESIANKEDLEFIYEHFIKNIASEELVNEFKELTGFRTKLDEDLDEACLDEGTSVRADEKEAAKWAQEISKREDCDVVYGYHRNGQFWQLAEPYKCKTQNELNMAHDLVVTKFKPTGSVSTWYRRNNDINLGEHCDKDGNCDICPKCGKPVNECTCCNEDIADDTVVVPETDCVVKTATDVMAAYQNANKWLDSVKEAIYTKMNCPFFSSYVHGLAHTMPERFDKFGDILHTVDIEIPYPTTEELKDIPENIQEAFSVIFNALDSIKVTLNAFIKCTDEEYHGMSCAAEALLNDIESEYSFLYRLKAKADEAGTDTITFDKFVGQYMDHKDDLLESVEHFKDRKSLSEAIQACKNNNRPYIIKKSTTEGYRYDLIKEAIEDDEDKEYHEKAKEFVEKIKGMDLEEVDKYLADYDFEHHAPEDEVEEMIYKALQDRRAELDVEDITDVETKEGFFVTDINETEGAEEEEFFETREEADKYFDSLKDKYIEEKDGTHTLYLWDSKDEFEYLRKWRYEEDIKSEYKDPTLTESFSDIKDIPEFKFDNSVEESKQTVNESPDQLPDTLDSHPEVIDAPEADPNAGTQIVPQNMDPRDVAIVDKLVRIANDTASAIHKYYGIDADPRLIVADMIQDLRLVSGDVRPEQLANTPLNNLTKEMYQEYNGFNDFIDDMFLGRRRSAAERLSQAVASLDSEEFQYPAIDQRIASDHFIEYVNRGALPFISDHIERLPAPEDDHE